MRNHNNGDRSSQLDIVNIRQKGNDKYEVLFKNINIPIEMNKSYLDVVLRDIGGTAM